MVEDTQDYLDNLDKETQKKIQEMQIIEQNFHQLLMQKQTFTFEANETKLALDELDKATGDVFKIVGSQIVIRTEKEELKKELLHKQELIELRLKTIDKQENDFSKKLESLRDEIIKKISNNKV